MKRLWPKINKIIYIFLSFFLVTLFLMLSYNAKTASSTIIIIAGVLILIEGLIEEKKKLKHERYKIATEIEVLLTVPIAATLTFFISTRIDLGYGLVGPVIAAGFIGLVGSYLKGYKLANPAYCGAFVGMSSTVVFPQLLLVSIAGLIAGFVFILSHEIYNQTGGTLGTIAFSAVNITKKIIMNIIGGFL